MSATPNSGPAPTGWATPKPGLKGSARWFCLAQLAWSLGTASPAVEVPRPAAPPPADLAAARQRVEEQLQAARAQVRANTNDAQLAWQLGRACFAWNELYHDPKQQEKLAKEGIASSRRALALDPRLAPAHYYLGLTLGQFADTKRNMAALKLVKEMEREFLSSRDLDEHFDQGGADRNLGLLYLQAPTLISIGSRSKARQHLLRSVELEPAFPENRLNLIETYQEWGEASEARRQLEMLEERWDAARSQLTGPEWEAAWPAWEKRRAAAKRKTPLPPP